MSLKIGAAAQMRMHVKLSKCVKSQITFHDVFIKLYEISFQRVPFTLKDFTKCCPLHLKFERFHNSSPFT
jgi:hypothetical protein